MFFGEYNHKIDAKGRVIIPNEFREELTDACVISKGLDGCLYIYPNSEWEAVLENLSRLPSNAKSRSIVRFFTAGAYQVETDAMGRILIKNELRTYAGITKEVVFAGAKNRIEVWDKAKYDEIINVDNIEGLVDEMAEEFGLSI
ncbi:MAG: division/cell wall cluster transcriptional repressor MraZ [Lachnospiraceae bacterium]|nr:division/cell wall cluster transcriptional repressor MraZ [Lachnospiraceae bacterium]